MNNFGNTFNLISNKNLRKELELCDKTIDKLTKKCEILEENNKLLIQQKAQMYKDLDIAYEKIDKALKMVSNEKYLHIERLEKIKDILGDKENE